MKEDLIEIAQAQLADPLIEENLAGWPYHGA